jgi:hypothetical protein
MHAHRIGGRLAVVAALLAIVLAAAAGCGGSAGQDSTVATEAAVPGVATATASSATTVATPAPASAASPTTVSVTSTEPAPVSTAPAPGTTVQAKLAGPVNLVFIHHSVGENWLNDGLCRALNEGGYHVADIYYGWREYGDHTDTTDWPTWFNDEVMPLVYADLQTMTAPNNLDAGPGENTVVMFKSCFPNSDVGSDISDEVALYQSLLPYFGQHLDKMFVLVTPPPMINISDARKTRELCDWLADRSSGWLAGYTGGNVFVFDLYNVLTDPGAHHRLVDGKETRESVKGHNTLYYDSDGDDHPNTRGNVKATEEFVGLLNAWYAAFAAR